MHNKWFNKFLLILYKIGGQIAKYSLPPSYLATIYMKKSCRYITRQLQTFETQGAPNLFRQIGAGDQGQYPAF